MIAGWEAGGPAGTVGTVLAAAGGPVGILGNKEALDAVAAAAVEPVEILDDTEALAAGKTTAVGSTWGAEGAEAMVDSVQELDYS